MNSRPKQIDELSYEIEVEKKINGLLNDFARVARYNMLVLEDSIIEFLKHPELSLEERLKTRIKVFLQGKDEPELPCILSERLLDLLYPPPAAIPTAFKCQWKVSFPHGDHVVMAVSESAALHMATVDALREAQFERNDDYHKAYVKLRSEARVVERPTESAPQPSAEGAVWLPTGEA